MKLTTQTLKKIIREELNKIHESGRKTRDYHYGSDSQGRAYASQGQYPPKKPSQPLSDPYPGQKGSMEMKMDMGLRTGENITMLERYYPKDVVRAVMSSVITRWHHVSTDFHLVALESLFEQLEEEMNSDEDIGLKKIYVKEHINYAKKIISFGKTLYKDNLLFQIALASDYDDIEDMMEYAAEHKWQKIYQENLHAWEALLPKFDEYEKKLEDINLTF